MCGIAGIISKKTNEVTQECLRAMTDSIAHRGPDGEGQWISEDGKVGLGHRRLSIIDLSTEADQPMHYLGRYSIVFNGEIYNYLELKETLKKQGYNFHTTGDTEVLLALYDRDKEQCLTLLDGMFSFVIYDKKSNEIFVARDRFGEKPFFYSYEKGEHFIFGSEMKVLWAAGIAKEANEGMLFKYLRDGAVENEKDLSETFYKNCYRLEHSHFLKFSVDALELKKTSYYDIDYKNINSNITTDQATEKFYDLFFQSVERRLRSDVPVGSSLSGGLDSSLVVSVIDKLKNGKNLRQETFSAVFPGYKKDERRYMDFVLAKTNVNPHFTTPSDADMLADMEKLIYHQEEPFGTASIYVQYCVMKLAKQNNVTVLLDGQGADEILAGYHHYYTHYFSDLFKDKELYRLQHAAYLSLHADSDINALLPYSGKQHLANKIKSKAPGLVQHYRRVKLERNNPFAAGFYQDHKNTYAYELQELSGLNKELYKNTFKSGLHELLRYSDRNSMAHSREVRLPFLQHDLVDFIFSLPPAMKINKGWTKWIMREAFQNILPPEITWRKDKIGYEPPQQQWMDSAKVRDIVTQSREKLVDKKILSPKIISEPNALISDWKIWMAAAMI